MTPKELGKRINELRYQLDEMDIIMRCLRKEWYEKGSFISFLRLHTISVRISDLIEAFNKLTEVEIRIVGEIDDTFTSHCMR